MSNRYRGNPAQNKDYPHNPNTTMPSENSNPPFGTGAIPSPLDPRTVKHEEVVAMAALPLVKGGIPYTQADIEHQHKVGICTAISLTQNRGKANGKKYSPDFQYLMQKKLYDINAPIGWDEGSSIFHALKVGKAVGFLESKHWTHTTEADRFLPYAKYIAKLRAIPEIEVNRLKALCVDKIQGYAEVNISNDQNIAKAIDDSEAGILCMYGCSDSWWSPSWSASDINPLRKKTFTSYHAIIMNLFDYSTAKMQRLSNSWGAEWCDKGCADINYSTYRMIEAWTVLPFPPVIEPYKFNKNLWFGKKDPDNIELQRRLGVFPTDENFGPKTFAAVIKYQWDHGIITTGFCGPITRASLNA